MELLILKKQLLHIKKYLDDNSLKVDISNVCVLEKEDICYIVKRQNENGGIKGTAVAIAINLRQ